MNKETYKSLIAMVDYLYNDEQKHWEESGRPKKGHIFLDVEKVSEWIDAEKPKGKKQKGEIKASDLCPDCEIPFGDCHC